MMGNDRKMGAKVNRHYAKDGQAADGVCGQALTSSSLPVCW